MKFLLTRDILNRFTSDDAPMTWIEAGEYPVVRLFDSRRVLIDCGDNTIRQLSVVPLSRGELIKEHA